MNQRKFNKAIERYKPSRKDFDHGKMVFGASGIPSTLPAELLFLSSILDQGTTEECTAFTAVAIRQSMKGKSYDPQSFWGAELQALGLTDAPQGVDLRTQMAVGVKTGFTLTGTSVPTDKASAYIAVYKRSGMDMFDSIRQTLNEVKVPLSVGLLWYAEWDFAPSGIVPHTQNNLLGGHDTKIAGFKNIGGIDYLVIQNSWGIQYGDKGLFYFDRQMANACFNLGVWYWSDDPSLEIKRLGLISAILQFLINLFQRQKEVGDFPPTQPNPWVNPASAKHAVRVICDEEGLAWGDKNELTACVQVESGFNPKAEHPNKDKEGNIWSTDYGICQVNDYWNIGEGKPFPSKEYVLDNPGACIRWMCKMWKTGHKNMWASYTSGLYKKYL